MSTRINKSRAQKKIFAIHSNQTIKNEINHRKKIASRKLLQISKLSSSHPLSFFARYNYLLCPKFIQLMLIFDIENSLVKFLASEVFSWGVISIVGEKLHISRILTTRRITLVVRNQRIFKWNRNFGHQHMILTPLIIRNRRKRLKFP